MLRVFKVQGSSMLPMLAGGDFVVGSRWYRRLRVGDLVVVDHPAYACLVKRVCDTSSVLGVQLCGENDSSLSQVAMGWISVERILAKVVWVIRQSG